MGPEVYYEFIINAISRCFVRCTVDFLQVVTHRAVIQACLGRRTPTMMEGKCKTWILGSK